MATLKEFNETVKEMRRIYPFVDSKTHICTKHDTTKNTYNLILQTVDEETETQILLERKMEKLEE